MSIVTKKGDRGETYFYQGRRVSKDHIRIESCGKESPGIKHYN